MDQQGTIPLHVEGTGLEQGDPGCGFESIALRYQLGDPALARLARIVPGAGGAIAPSFTVGQGDNDHEKVRLEAPIYGALYTWCGAQPPAPY